MNITPELIAPLLREYGISTAITNVEYFINRQNSDDNIKIVAKVEVRHRSPLVLKLTREPSHSHIEIERQCVFAEHLRRNGIATPEHYSAAGNYCLERTIDGVRVNVVLEDFAESETSAVDVKAAREAGKLMARIHRLSFRDNFKIGAPTMFNALGRNNVSGIDRFRELAEKAEASMIKSVSFPHRFCKKPELCREIIAIYDRKLASAADVWGRLPCSAVQGDISVSNLYTSGDRLGVFDFNNAGDETLIGDMILEGLLMANESKLAEGLSDSDRPAIFRSFLDGYRSICPLTSDERMAACELYPAYSALWFTKVERLSELMHTPGACEKADEMLGEMYGEINSDARRIFASELFE